MRAHNYSMTWYSLIYAVSEVTISSLDYKNALSNIFSDISEEDNIKRYGQAHIYMPCIDCSVYVITLWIFRLSWVEVDGSVYHTGDVVVLKNELLPTFGVIKDIIVMDVNGYFFVTEVLTTENFVEHYHSFEITKQSPTIYDICQQKSLADHHVLSAYDVENSTMIPLKYYLIENL